MNGMAPTVPDTPCTGRQLAAAILTRRLRKCIAEGAHPGNQPAAPDQPKCPRCGQ